MNFEQRTGKSFPRYCDRCRKRTVWPATIPYKTHLRHDGVLNSLEIPNLIVPRCNECDELYFDNDAETQISRAFRSQLHLLMPEAIQAGRMALGLTHEQFAARLGVTAEQVANWEEGLQFQSRAIDDAMRSLFGAIQGTSQHGTPVAHDVKV